MYDILGTVFLLSTFKLAKVLEYISSSIKKFYLTSLEVWMLLDGLRSHFLGLIFSLNSSLNGPNMKGHSFQEVMEVFLLTI